MTQKASPETVVAPFDDINLTNRGRSYHLENRGDEFWVHMPDPDWEGDLRHRGVDLSQVPEAPIVERRVVMTTGSHHYQGYWVPSRHGNQLWQLPFVFHFEDQRWIPREDVFLHPPSDHRSLVIWNVNCIQCHVVAGKPGLGPDKNALYSSFVEMGIACESCHGPGANHVRYHRNALSDRSHPDESGDPTIVNPAHLSAERSAQVCGQCHSFFFHKHHDDWWQNGFSNSYRPGDDLRESRYLPKYNEKFTDPVAAGWANQIPGGLNGKFWPDGTVRLGGREYVGLIESSCYLNGKGAQRITCISCHSMHDYQEPADLLSASLKGNQSCTQCHNESEFTENLQQHTYHLAASEGSRCINCHMPRTSYALLKAIRSHRIDTPNVETSQRTGRPNACNLCHLDRTLKWSSRYLSKWYQHPEVEMSEDEQNIAASVLWLLKGDAAQRVVTSWHLGWSPAQQASGRLWLVPFLADLLNDPYAAVRFVSYRSLRSLPGYEEFRYNFLADPSERKESIQQALELWPSKESIRGRSEQNSAAVLLNPDGEVNRSVFKRLVNQRDNRPVYLSE